MKSTEIEVERVVSTSGLLTGRPNASWPRRVPALPWRTNIKTCFSLSLQRGSIRSPCSHLITLPPLCCVVRTVHNATPTQMHATHMQTLVHPLSGGERASAASNSNEASSPSGPGGLALHARLAGVWLWRGTVSYHWAVPGQSCVTGIRINDSPPLHCLVYHPLPPSLSLSPLSNYKTN